MYYPERANRLSISALACVNPYSRNKRDAQSTSISISIRFISYSKFISFFARTPLVGIEPTQTKLTAWRSAFKLQRHHPTWETTCSPPLTPPPIGGAKDR
jgi:hypothetical protein